MEALTGGRVSLFGEPPHAHLLRGAEAGWAASLNFPPSIPIMTGWENLQIHCDYKGYSRPKGVEEALEQLELDDLPTGRWGSYPLGRKQRLWTPGLCCASLS